MRRIAGFSIIPVLALAVTPARAQYASINIDYATMEAMTEAYGAEAITESLHKNNIEKIYNSYVQAELAAAGIFGSKYLDRKALTSLNLWDDRQENFYYHRIYRIVTTGIIPNTVRCTELLIEDPVNAMYWGSYMFKVTEDVMSLCKQFETVVTNSTLNFKDIAFVEIKDQLKDIFNLTQLGGQDWKAIFEQLFDDIQGSFTKEKLKEDLQTLISHGAGLAGAGYRNVINQAMQGTDFGGTLADRVGSVITLVDNVESMYEQYRDMSATQVLGSIVGDDDINGIFKLGDYNVTRWIDDLSLAAEGDQYTQRVYIYYGDAGSERVCNYIPSNDIDAILYGSEWYRISTTDMGYVPTSSEMEAALANSENHAGWSRTKVEQLNAQADGGHYSFDANNVNYMLNGMSAGVFGKAYAFEIEVVRTWDRKETVYEEVFDSYTMDWNTFMSKMNARLESYNQNGADMPLFGSEEEMNAYIAANGGSSTPVYKIGYDDRHYYQAADTRMVKGSSTATFHVACSGGGKLGDGSTTYKCEHCGSQVSDHTRSCAMLSSLESSNDNAVSELEKQLALKQAEATRLQSQIDALNLENSNINRQISQSTDMEEVERLQATYKENQAKIADLEAQLTEAKKEIEELKHGVQEAEQEQNLQTDDYQRIPYLMQYMQNAFGFNWLGEGSWSGATFTRNGTMGGGDGAEVTFKATLSIIRKPKWVFGIQVHRAIVQIDWECTSSWTDSSIAEVMELDPEKSDDANAMAVNMKLSELAQTFPGCDVSVECQKTAGTDSIQDNDGTFHLLWASDRLEIARDIEHRLLTIHVELVNLNKFLHYKHGVRDLFATVLPRLNADRGRRFNIAEQSRRKWLRNAGSPQYSDEDSTDVVQTTQPPSP